MNGILKLPGKYSVEVINQGSVGLQAFTAKRASKQMTLVLCANSKRFR